MRTGERGFTYLVLLFVLAAAAAAVTVLAESAQAAAQREREAELLFRGQAIRKALLDWQRNTPPGQPAAPRTLEELLQDTRGSRPLHHLRQIYPCPFSGRPDWQLLRDERGGIVGVASRAPVPAQRQARLGEGVRVKAADPARPRVDEWWFEVDRPGVRRAPP